VADNLRALELTQESFRIGKTDLRSVQQQQLSLRSARQALLRVQSEQLSQRTNLHLALGGSFEQPPPPETAAN
jgi:outer membrane protein TolC